MRACVIGAGFAGLAAADSLAAAGVDVVVLEANDRVGGRVWSDRLPSGALIERGGEFITGGYDETERFCARLGLELVGMGIRYPERELRPDPGIRREEALAAAVAVEAAAALNPRTPALELLASLVQDDAIRELFASRVQSAEAYPIDDLDAGHLMADDEARRVRGGNDLIAKRLAAGLGPVVRLGTPARRIVHDDAGARVLTDDGEVEADVVIVAIPLALLPELDIEPALPDRLGDALARIPTSTAAKLAAPLVTPTPSNAIMSVPRALLGLHDAVRRGGRVDRRRLGRVGTRRRRVGGGRRPGDLARGCARPLAGASCLRGRSGGDRLAGRATVGGRCLLRAPARRRRHAAPARGGRRSDRARR